jgi:DNA-binding transcriptional LysR family regulator
MNPALDLNALRAFRAIAEHGSFSAAADLLHLSQPAVSRRISQLEEGLGTRLFDRVGRRVLLTEAGRALLPHAVAVEHSLSAAERAVLDLDGEVTGRLQLGTSHHIGLHRLPQILSAFKKAYPLVQLDIRFMDSEQAYGALAAGDIELAVATLAPEPLPHVEQAPLWHDPLDISVAPDHPLATKKRVRLRDLAQHDAVLPGLDTFTGQLLLRSFSPLGPSLRVAMSTNYLETLRMLAAVGLGWTVLPSSMRSDDLVCLHTESLSLERTLGYAHHRQRSLSRSASALVSALRAAADDSLRAC